MSRSASTVAALALVLAACGDDVDRAELTDSARGDTAYEALDYELTSDNYRKWLHANALFDSMAVTPARQVSTIDPSDDEIDAAIEALEDDERARAALDSADISAEDHVLTTIAMAQSWDAVNAPGRVAGAPERNVDFLRSGTAGAAFTATRPSARYVNDDAPRKRGKGKAKGKRKGRGRDK